MPTPDQLKQLSESLEGTLYTMIFIKRYMRQMLCIPDKTYRGVAQTSGYCKAGPFCGKA
jgi:hypothetical protein